MSNRKITRQNWSIAKEVNKVRSFSQALFWKSEEDNNKIITKYPYDGKVFLLTPLVSLDSVEDKAAKLDSEYTMLYRI